jgi:uncharacterized membrane protein YjfL (UPF0719 family)
MAGIVDIISAVVVGIIVLLVSFYLFTMYCHRTDQAMQLRREDSATAFSQRYS